ncbi:unnamed protein product [Prorocentrum cordatum]|uniref:Uncharacterized protein n=1 Tax=Prorocentrum cordatum TaxID=2364126 RepID=A0ABN9UG93_9DINO|nr:unnamed protein product [Polarella glacialis]
MSASSSCGTSGPMELPQPEEADSAGQLCACQRLDSDGSAGAAGSVGSARHAGEAEGAEPPLADEAEPVSDGPATEVWDCRAQQSQMSFDSPGLFASTPVHSVDLHPNQVELVAGDDQGRVHVWDLVSGRVRRMMIPQDMRTGGAGGVETDAEPDTLPESLPDPVPDAPPDALPDAVPDAFPVALPSDGRPDAPPGVPPFAFPDAFP